MVKGTEFWFKEYHSENSGIFFRIDKILFAKDTPFQRVEVVDTPEWGRVLLLNGLVMLTERDEFIYHEMLVHPAMVLHENPLNILIVGGGDGGSVREVLKYNVVDVTLVEIDKEVVNASKEYLPFVSSGYRDPRVKTVFEDGFEFLKKCDDLYDLIIVDSTDPVGPAKSLFEEEFYHLTKRRLKEGGILSLQSESPIFHIDIMVKISNRLKKFYNDVFFYTAPIPTYPGGLWSFAIASDNLNPEEIKRNPPEGLKYYNREIHLSSFKLPNFIKDELS
jgi:spermidine synthase